MAWLAIYVITITTIAVIGFLIIYYDRQRRKLEREKRILLIQQAALREQYEQLDEALKISRQYRQEISEMMEHGLEEEEPEEWILGMVQEESQTEAETQTAFSVNPLIQAIFRHKAMECEKKKIALSMDVEGIDSLRVKDIDLSGILYNIFDNAIEACMRISDPSRRYIRISFRRGKRSGHLKMENACLSDNVAAGRKTWKADEESHGIGLTILKDLAAENRGRINIIQQEDRFITEIWLPLKKQNH